MRERAVRYSTMLATTIILAGCGAGEQPRAADTPPAAVEELVAGQPLSYWREGLTHTDSEVRRVTALGLGGLGREALPLLPDVIACLADDAPEVVTTAREALLAVGAPALPGILEALASHENEAVRAQLARTLREVRPTTPEIVTALGEAVAGDDSWQVRFRAAESLGEIGPDAAAAEAVLRAALEDEDGNVQTAARAALQRLQN